MAYFKKQDFEYYSHDIAMEYVKIICAKEIDNPELQLTAGEAYLYRIVCSLTDFMECGVIRRKYIRRMPYCGAQSSVDILLKFSNQLNRQGLSDSTVKSVYRTAERFMSYLDANDISIDCLNVQILQRYFIVISGYAKKTMEGIVYGLRRYVSFLHDNGYNDNDLVSCIPTVNVMSKASVPSVWNNADFKILLENVDRNNPIGRRDYAILLLAGKLGMRSVDIKLLTFSSIDWEQKKIIFTQSKTDYPVVLPLLPDVGWAIIDYLKNGRPKNDSEFVFLRHSAPIAPLTKDDHLYHVVKKYMLRAGIDRKDKSSGLHSLRHTLATELLENHTPISDISNVLGHENADTTGIYLKTSIDLLRECAQEVTNGI